MTAHISLTVWLLASTPAFSLPACATSPASLLYLYLYPYLLVLPEISATQWPNWWRYCGLQVRVRSLNQWIYELKWELVQRWLEMTLTWPCSWCRWPDLWSWIRPRWSQYRRLPETERKPVALCSYLEWPDAAALASRQRWRLRRITEAQMLELWTINMICIYITGHKPI